MVRNSRQTIRDSYRDNSPQIKKASVFFLCALCVFAVNFSFAKINYNLYFQNGLKQIESGKYEEAVKSFSLYIANDSSKAAAFYNRAIAYKNSGKSAAAVSDLNKVLQLDVTDTLAKKQLLSILFQLAMQHYHEADTTKALHYLESYIELNQKDDIVFFNYGVILSAKNEKEKAIQNFSKAIDINSNNTYYLARAVDYFLMKNYDACLPDLDKVLTEEPNDTSALWIRSQIYYVKQNLEGSKTDLEALLKIKPENESAKTMLADVSMQLFIEKNWYYAAIIAVLLLAGVIAGIIALIGQKTKE
jgi:tetratricopeptide (TPR) repeat protein